MSTAAIAAGDLEGAGFTAILGQLGVKLPETTSKGKRQKA